MKYKITCGRCGFITYDADDMIRHLSLTQKHSEENCRERFIKVEDVEDKSPAQKGKEAIKRLRERN